MLEFLEFRETVGEKHLGIASICVGSEDNTLHLSFKVYQSTKGPGYFISSPSFKINDEFHQAIVFNNVDNRKKIFYFFFRRYFKGIILIKSPEF